MTSTLGSGRRLGEFLQRPVRADAEFALFQPRRDIGMGHGVDIRVDPQRHARARAFSPCHVVDGLKFGGRFHVEQQDVGVQGIGDFLGTLSDPGKHDLVRGHAGLQRAKQFTARYDVGPAAERRHKPENGQVRIGLHGKRDEMGNRSEGLVKGLKVPGQRRVTVEVAGCALFFGEAFERDVFTEERIHCDSENHASCGSSSNSSGSNSVNPSNAE